MANELVNDKKRKEIEDLIYQVYDTIDPTHTNTDYYRGIFSKMTNNQFYHFMERRLPFRCHVEAFKVEPKMPDVVKAFKLIGVPLIEKINLPHIYSNDDGTPVQSQDCMVIYIHIKRMKQMISKKNNSSMNVGKRNMRTGLLLQEDKGGKETDREFESLASYGLDETIDEFRTVKADAMGATAEMIQTIMNKGSVSKHDYVLEKQDSLGRNMLNVYLIGAGIHSNLVDTDYMVPNTLANKHKQIERIQ